MGVRRSRRLRGTIDLSVWRGRFVLMLVLLFFLTIESGCSSWKAARFYQSGSHALEEGDSAKAISDLERAAALKPESSEIQNHLGIAYESAGRKALALEAFKRAVALDCENVAASRNLAALRQEAPFGSGGRSLAP